MAKLTKSQIQVAYAQTIEILFAGSVKATPSQITPEVIAHVDTMVREIAECSKAITDLNFKLIYKAATLAIANPIIDYFANNFYQRLAAKLAVGKIGSELNKWIQSIMGNRMHMFCVITARSRWRSPIEIALLGL